MDYKEMVRRIDEIQMSARDRAAVKAQLAHAERLADWTLATTDGLRRSISVLNDVLRPAIAKIRSSFHRIWAA